MQIQDASDMMLTLTRATANYIHRRIENLSHRNAYAKGMSRCVDAMKSASFSHSLMREKLNLIEQSVDQEYKQSFFKRFRLEREYYLLAVENCIDIIDSIEARFVTGTCDSDPRFYKNKSLLVYKNELNF
jgi:hypothetical protein